MLLDWRGVAILSAVVVGVGFYTAKKAQAAVVETAGVVTASVNPLDRGNVIYRSINALGDVLDDGVDDDSFSLGGWTYELFN